VFHTKGIEKKKPSYFVALGQHLSYQMQGLIFVLFLLGGCKIEWSKVWQEIITFLVQNNELF
jgi:hypothetical protein